LGIENKVRFTGYVSETVLDDLYSLSDAFVMASPTETQGLVLLEALVHNLPLVVADAPVIGDFVRKTSTGFVAKPSALACAIRRMLLDPSVRRAARMHAARVLKEFDIKRCASRLLEIYNNAIDQYSHFE
jgi:glycosyltransferase involved in cell wall biosynthesis